MEAESESEAELHSMPRAQSDSELTYLFGMELEPMNTSSGAVHYSLTPPLLSLSLSHSFTLILILSPFETPLYTENKNRMLCSRYLWILYSQRRPGAILLMSEKSHSKSVMLRRAFSRQRSHSLPAFFRFYTPDANPILSRSRRMTLATPTFIPFSPHRLR
jgi:hypothetical protein